MDARSIVAKLRQGEVPEQAELMWFANGLGSGAVSDAQAGAFAMAVCLNGLGEAGRSGLTRAMRDSGRTMRWDLPGPVVDKHSTGGIGDVVSLLLAPMLAAVGLYVPMISGRGLGHTGGTLDKLEAIPGVRVDQSPSEFETIVREVGCAIVSASPDIAPADKRLYAVRDVTATVESVDLITASILSKKMAAGLEALVLDVKLGTGAFLPSQAAAQELAEALVSTANAMGCKTAALLTDMNEPLAPAAGNALEVGIVLDVLNGDVAHSRLTDVTCALAARLAALAGLEAGLLDFQNVLSDGRAAEKFDQMIAALGGPADVVGKGRKVLANAALERPVPATEAGFVQAVDARALGEASVRLGAGRLRADDMVDPSVGLSALMAVGQKIDAGAPLACVHAGSDVAAERAIAKVQAAYSIGATPPEPRDLILGEVA